MNTVGTKIASNSELEIFIQSERQSRNSSTTSVPSDVRKTLFSKFRKKFRSPEPRPVREMKLVKNEMIKPKLSGPSLSVQDIRCVNLICALLKSFLSVVKPSSVLKKWRGCIEHSSKFVPMVFQDRKVSEQFYLRSFLWGTWASIHISSSLLSTNIKQEHIFPSATCHRLQTHTET